MEESDERPSLFGPIILIAIGLVFLLNNLGIMTGDIWGLLLRLWPLLFIAAGVDSLLRQRGVAGPVFLLAIGSLFLLGNYGFLSVNIWTFLIRLWPLLLIVGGLDLIIGRRSLWISVPTALLVLAILGVALWTSGTLQVDRGTALESQTIQQPLGEYESALIVIDPGVGSLQIQPLRDSANLIEGTIPENRNRTIREDFAIRQGTGVYRLGGSYFNVFPFSSSSGGAWEWALGLTAQVPLQLEVDLGAGDLDLDLSGLTVTELNVNLGVGDASVRLPADGDFRGRIDGGIGQITLFLPADLPVRIDVDTGIGNVSVPAGYSRDGDAYLSPAFVSSGTGVELSLDLGIGNLSLQEVR